MLTHNIMLKQILVFAGININLIFPDVPHIPFITIIYTTSTSNITHPYRYYHLCMPLLNQNESKNKFVPYKKDFMSLIIIMNPNCQLGTQKVVQ